jgi:hypothetical protein
VHRNRGSEEPIRPFDVAELEDDTAELPGRVGSVQGAPELAELAKSRLEVAHRVGGPAEVLKDDADVHSRDGLAETVADRPMDRPAAFVARQGLLAAAEELEDLAEVPQRPRLSEPITGLATEGDGLLKCASSFVVASTLEVEATQRVARRP